jgi:hypothetical protein
VAFNGYAILSKRRVEAVDERRKLKWFWGQRRRPKFYQGKKSRLELENLTGLFVRWSSSFFSYFFHPQTDTQPDKQDQEEKQGRRTISTPINNHAHTRTHTKKTLSFLDGWMISPPLSRTFPVFLLSPLLFI